MMTQSWPRAGPIMNVGGQLCVAWGTAVSQWRAHHTHAAGQGDDHELQAGDRAVPAGLHVALASPPDGEDLLLHQTPGGVPHLGCTPCACIHNMSAQNRLGQSRVHNGDAAEVMHGPHHDASGSI